MQPVPTTESPSFTHPFFQAQSFKHFFFLDHIMSQFYSPPPPPPPPTQFEEFSWNVLVCAQMHLANYEGFADTEPKFLIGNLMCDVNF